MIFDNLPVLDGATALENIMDIIKPGSNADFQDRVCADREVTEDDRL